MECVSNGSSNAISPLPSHHTHQLATMFLITDTLMLIARTKFSRF